MSTTTTTGRSPAEVWRAARRPLLIVAALIAVLVVLILFTGARTSGPFSPDSTEPSGAKALAVLLGNHHVAVTGTESLSAATDEAGGTLLVAPGGSLNKTDWQDINGAGWDHIVLLRPPSIALDELAPGVDLAGVLSFDIRQAHCDIPAAHQAGEVSTAGVSYSAPSSADSCYGDGIHGSVVRIEDGGRTIDVIGTPTSFTNQHLADDGNAALALDLLGTHDRLVWYLPRFESDTVADGNSDLPLVPAWARYALWMSVLTAFVAAP